MLIVKVERCGVFYGCVEYMHALLILCRLERSPLDICLGVLRYRY